MEPEIIFKKKPEIVTRQIADETLLVPVKGNLADMRKVFILEGVADFIWSHIDGVASEGDIAKEVSGFFNISLDEASKDCGRLFVQLSGAGLIEEVGNP